VIGRLIGLPMEEAEGALVLDVNGVGYELQAPMGTLGRAPRDLEGRVTLRVHTHVREDALTLFGFANELERMTFRTLIAISSIGPKTALAILSALPAGDLATAVAAKDLKRLTDVPGVGKKTAERLVLELRDKLPALCPAEPPTATKPGKPGTARETLVSALVHMGYRAVEAERAVGQLEDKLDGAPLADLVREALVLLAK
jgi:Holliday junction DNA helicase RuvA